MDAILYWNDVALEAVARDHTGSPAPLEQGGPTRTARALAIVHLAMYDAFNSITGSYTPYLPNLPMPTPGASVNAALGAAALTTLSQLYPSQYPRFLQAHQAFLAGLTDGAVAITEGREQGQQVAEALLTLRQTDGSSNSVPYVSSPDPGRHRPDPLNPAQGYLTPHWGQVKPFGITSAEDFVADPFPPLDSARYAQDFNDVKEKGALTGGTRTPEETTIGLFWAYDGAQKLGTPPRLYNQIVRVIAEQQLNTLEQSARLFALVNMAMADAGIQCWYSKYFYNIWRPVVGVREADAYWGPSGVGDGNLETAGDPYWLPLGAPRTNQVGAKNFTPNFPAYPSGHATFGAASLDMVRLFYNNDNIAFEFVSDELNGESLDVEGYVRTKHSRPFARLSDAIEENGRSRVYLGVHWQSDAVAGIASGQRIAEYLYTNYLLPTI
ncbi:phosphatase PAP2 family protein [Leptolyngbya sp. NK1-12]|uniref:Phosphatase PAP2 family protein n=1 Tax=Leptolyngbya sp. NK1-12 TaxID=2547451 RepID=A0AA97AGP9_9CYAN|nr:phosphatase PAP2 family protein [Leptolyngbya sp. NK1-12]